MLYLQDVSDFASVSISSLRPSKPSSSDTHIIMVIIIYNNSIIGIANSGDRASNFIPALFRVTKMCVRLKPDDLSFYCSLCI